MLYDVLVNVKFCCCLIILPILNYQKLSCKITIRSFDCKIQVKLIEVVIVINWLQDNSIQKIIKIVFVAHNFS